MLDSLDHPWQSAEVEIKVCGLPPQPKLPHDLLEVQPPLVPMVMR
jgi:hypothetical protein